MKKTEDKIKAMITEEQLKTVSEQQNELSNALRNIGVLEVQKLGFHKLVEDVSKKIDVTKKELEEEYGQVNIDLTDGSYVEIEKEDAK